LNAIDPREWVEISAPLDEAMELPEGEHACWLAALPEPERRYGDTLRRLLAEQARIRTSDFMSTLPKLADAAVSRGERDVGPYRLLRELGRGGMGSVWLARRTDGLLKREVALKLPHAGLASADFAERLARERDILATLAHPNILVTAQGEVRLLDFGIAKLMTDGRTNDTELTQQGGRPLTPEYASPEQISGQPIGTASDVYALGVLLCELLCGQHPYALRRASRGALEEAFVAGEPVRPSAREISAETAALRSTTPHALKRALAGGLDVIVLEALKKDPAQRYTTADALRQDLQRHLDGQAVLARPDGALYRVG
jgi:eukaryotic-like serine/threonine-protein kinase